MILRHMRCQTNHPNQRSPGKEKVCPASALSGGLIVPPPSMRQGLEGSPTESSALRTKKTRRKSIKRQSGMSIRKGEIFQTWKFPIASEAFGLLWTSCKRARIIVSEAHTVASDWCSKVSELAGTLKLACVGSGVESLQQNPGAAKVQQAPLIHWPLVIVAQSFCV